MKTDTHECTACSCTYTEDEGGIQGYFGIMPMSFCPTCLSSVIDMVSQINPREWVSLTDDDEIDWEEGGNLIDLIRAIEAKLMEKNT